MDSERDEGLFTDDSVRLFPLREEEVWEFSRLIFENRHKSFAELSEEARARFLEIRVRIRFMIWRVARHEAKSAGVVREAARRVIAALEARLGWNRGLSQVIRVLSRVTWRRQSARSWIFRRTRQAVQELIRRTNIQPTSAADPDLDKVLEVEEPMLSLLARTKGSCKLRCGRRSPELVREGHCRRACDLLLLKKLEFTKKELGLALQIPASTALDRLYDCQAESIRLQQMRRPQPALASAGQSD